MSTPRDAPYKLKQQKPKYRVLATSRELSQYQRAKRVSALTITNQALKELAK